MPEIAWNMVADGATDSKPVRIVCGTDQQEAFWSELHSGPGHVLLEARAGTGKSTSCREGMWRLLSGNARLAIRYCCFNKKITDEFAETCPPGVEVGTMHRFGLLSLAAAFGTKVEKDKTYIIIDQIGMGSSKRYVRRQVARLVGLAKNHACDPGRMDDVALDAAFRWLIHAFDIETYRDTPGLIGRATEALRRSAEMTAVADFDDMLWLPVLHQTRFPALDFLFIDECQDLNPIQHEMVPIMARGGRTVVVGDPYQSIYAFRGADSDSIPKLRDKLDAVVLPLTVTFRCPRLHVEAVRRLVPDFEAGPDNDEGTLEDLPAEAIDQEVEPGDLVLCRANAPIVAACLRQVAARRRAVVRGRAIGENLTAILRGIDATTTADLVRGIGQWRFQQIAALESRDGSESLIEAIQDKADCLDVIAAGCSSPAEVPGVIADLFSDADASSVITFSSVHRAKGSEARRVFYLQIPYSVRRDRERPPQQWELDQRRNVEYVARTRSRDYLAILTPEKMGD